MLKFSYLILLLYSTSNLYAKTNLATLTILAEEAHQIVERAAPISDNFKQNSEDSERLVAYAQYQDEIRQIVNADDTVSIDSKITAESQQVNCDPGQFTDAQKAREEINELVKKRRWVVGASASYNTGDELVQELSSFTGSKLTKALNDNGHGWIKDYDSLVDFYLKHRPTIKAQWDSISDEQKIDYMKEYLQARFELDIPREILETEHVVSNTIKTPSKWKENMESLKNKLSHQGKLDLIAHIGGKLLPNFDDDRPQKDLTKISTEQMFSGLNSETPTGECRDIIAAQSEIAIALGIEPKNIFRIGYQAASESHQTLAIVDPNNPDKLYKINYSESQVDEQNKGVAQLKQGGSMPVTGIAYRVYDAYGKAVLETPTELGKMLREASGFDTTNDISKNYNINKAFVKTDYGEGAIVTGELSDGTKVSAITFNGNKLGVDYGASVYKTDSENERQIVTTEGFYGFIKMNPNYTYKVTDKISAKANFEYSAELQASKSSATYKTSGKEYESDVLLEPTIGIIPGAEVSYTGKDVDAYVRVEADTFLWSKDAQAQAERSPSGKGILLNGINYKSGISVQATEDLNAALDAAVYTRNLGDYYIVSAALKDTKRNYVIEAKHQAPISKDDMISFAPGSYSVTQISGSKSWLKEDNTGPTVTFEYIEDEQAGGRVNLGGSWAFY